MPICNQILRDLQILHPILRGSPLAASAFGRLCDAFGMLKLTDEEVDKILEEWRFYQDLYWANVFQITDADTGKPKYSNLSRVVKACLLLFHGNADVERGYSQNNLILRKDRANLNERSIISIRIVKDAIRRNGNLISNVPITSALLKKVKEARKEYYADLECQKKEEIKTQQKRLQENENAELKVLRKRQHDIEDELKSIENKREKIQNDVKLAQQLLDEESECLGKALQKKDVKEAAIASSIIEAGKEKIDKNIKILSETEEEKKLLNTKLTLLKK